MFHNKNEMIKMILKKVDMSNKEAEDFLDKLEQIEFDYVTHGEDYYIKDGKIYDDVNNFVCEIDYPFYPTYEGWAQGTNFYCIGSLSGGWPQPNHIYIYDIDAKKFIYIEFEKEYTVKNVKFKNNKLEIFLLSSVFDADIKHTKEKVMLFNPETYEVLNPEVALAKPYNKDNKVIEVTNF